MKPAVIENLKFFTLKKTSLIASKQKNTNLWIYALCVWLLFSLVFVFIDYSDFPSESRYADFEQSFLQSVDKYAQDNKVVYINKPVEEVWKEAENSIDDKGDRRLRHILFRDYNDVRKLTFTGGEYKITPEVSKEDVSFGAKNISADITSGLFATLVLVILFVIL